MGAWEGVWGHSSVMMYDLSQFSNGNPMGTGALGVDDTGEGRGTTKSRNGGLSYLLLFHTISSSRSKSLF